MTGVTGDGSATPAARACAAVLLRIAAGAALVLPVTGGALAQRVLLISSSDAPAFQRATAGSQKGAAGVAFEAHRLTKDNHETLARAVARAGRDVAVVTLGLLAAELAASAAPAGPMVSCMIPANAGVLPHHAIRVPIEIPVDAQIAWLGKLLPAARRIGLLFDPAISAQRIDALAPALARAGFSLLLAPVPSAATLPSALERLTGSVDAMLAIPDPTVYTPQASRALLLYSFRNRIPLIGLADAWVRAGALYALDWDFEELGRYCGALAARAVVSGRAPPPAMPRPRVAVNRRTAEQLGVKWSPELLRTVDRTYE